MRPTRQSARGNGLRGETLVVFGGEGSGPWARMMKPGFRHCFMLRRLQRSWLLFDPRANGLVLEEWGDHDPARLIATLEGQGYRVLPAAGQPLELRALLPAPFTCAEAVKRALGLTRPRVATPWGLFKVLSKK